jgi:hypothetical protein
MGAVFFNAEELGLWVMMKNKIIYGEIEIQDCAPQETILEVFGTF